jgi:hypothetical protein
MMTNKAFKLDHIINMDFPSVLEIKPPTDAKRQLITIPRNVSVTVQCRLTYRAYWMLCCATLWESD